MFFRTTLSRIFYVDTRRAGQADALCYLIPFPQELKRQNINTSKKPHNRAKHTLRRHPQQHGHYPP